MIEIENDLAQHVMISRASGKLVASDLERIAPRVAALVREFNGRPFFFLADMRGLQPLSPETGTVLAEMIARTKQAGVVLCAHLTDSGIMRLQAACLARQSADSFNVDVVSEAEANKVFADHWHLLGARSA